MKKKLFSILVFALLLNFSSACFFDSNQDNPNDPYNKDVIHVPKDLSIGIVTINSISFSWNGSPNITGYRIYRSFDDVTYTELTSVSQGVSYTGISYTDTGLTAGTTYYYQVSAYNNKGESAKCSSKSVATLSNAANLILGAITDNTISISWGNITGAEGYRVYRSSDGITFIQISGNVTSTTSYIDTGLPTHAIYYYVVTSYNSGGESAKSNSIEAETHGLPIVQTIAIAGNVAKFASMIPISGYIAGTSAMGGGNITDSGGTTVTDRGVCWSTSELPTISNSHVSDIASIQTGEFTSSAITGLTANTTYHVRAYAVNSSGTAYGEDVSFNSGYTFGSSVSGGLVFYNDGTGHGMVCAVSDQSSTQIWISGTYQTTAIGVSAQGTSIGTGQTNTAAIMTADSSNNNAAYICSQVGSGWFLPSKDELACIYANLHSSGFGSFTAAGYFSSTECSETSAWGQDFNITAYGYYPGNQITASKNSHTVYTYNISVRAVSSF